MNRVFGETINYPHQGIQPKRPDSMLWLAIFTTVVCCVPFGVYAIILSVRVDDLYIAGEYERAEMTAAESRKWSVLGIVISGVFYVIVIIFYVVFTVITYGEIFE